MREIRINTDKSYSASARTILSGDSKSLDKTFERIRSGKGLPDITRVEDNDNVIYSNRLNLAPQEGSGYWEFTHLSHELYLIATDFQYRETRVETVLGEGFLEFHFKVSGELLLELDAENRLSVRGPSLLIWKQPAGITCKEWIVGGAHESSFTLYCKPGLFLNQLGIDRKRLPGIISSFLDRKNEVIEYEIISLNPAMAFSITDVAQTVGYEYQTSFTAAVKHFFGVTPRQLRSRARRE